MRYFRILSLDVALGACVMTYFFSYYFGQMTNWAYYVSLGLTVWLIYTLDHLLDARKIPHQAHTPRHRFHQAYYWQIFTLWTIVFLLTGFLSFQLLTYTTLVYGLFLCILVGIHFLLGKIHILHRLFFFQKEIRIALVYGLGVALAPFSLSQQVQLIPFLLLLIQVILMASVNLLIISYYEAETDKKDHHQSIVTLFGEEIVQRLAYLFILLVLLIGIILAILLWNKKVFLTECILVLMILSLYTVLKIPHYFKNHERYRIWSDSVFFYPLLLLVFNF